MVRGMAINTVSTYYVDGPATRAAINWGSAVTGGVATQPIYKLVVTDTHENLSLAYSTGDVVSSAAVTAAQAETTGGGIPTVVKPKSSFGPQASEDFIKKTAVTGSVTLDVRGGSVFELNLTGNVSAFAISNPGAAGRMLELHFVQDSTGSRTLSGVNANIKFAGGSLTLTTTASKRDVVRLRHVGAGKFVEISRALNS
jgi:hypothetical protein